MKKIVLFVLAAAGAWWYFVGSRTLSEESVLSFYQQQEAATLSRDPEKLCALLDEAFQAKVIAVPGSTRGGEANRAQTCDGYRAMYQGFEALGDKMGGILQLDYNFTLHKIELAPDKKSATVDVSYSLDVAGSIMHIRTRSTETIIQKLGKPLMIRSEGTSGLTSGG
jgi:hypothetical protein